MWPQQNDGWTQQFFLCIYSIALSHLFGFILYLMYKLYCWMASALSMLSANEHSTPAIIHAMQAIAPLRLCCGRKTGADQRHCSRAARGTDAKSGDRSGKNVHIGTGKHTQHTQHTAHWRTRKTSECRHCLGPLAPASRNRCRTHTHTHSLARSSAHRHRPFCVAVVVAHCPGTSFSLFSLALSLLCTRISSNTIFDRIKPTILRRFEAAVPGNPNTRARTLIHIPTHANAMQ